MSFMLYFGGVILKKPLSYKCIFRAAYFAAFVLSGIGEMIKLNKAVIHRFVQIFLFFCGIVLVHLLALGLTSSSWGDVLRSISQQDIEQMLADIERYFFSTLLHLYIISYLLFACLPVKIRCSRWWLRGIYFVIFYFLNICIYLWI